VPIEPVWPASHVPSDQVNEPPGPNEPRTQRPAPSKRKYQVAASGVPLEVTANDCTSPIVSTAPEATAQGAAMVPEPLTVPEPS
jgi:hypothetical protein